MHRSFITSQKPLSCRGRSPVSLSISRAANHHQQLQAKPVCISSCKPSHSAGQSEQLPAALAAGALGLLLSSAGTCCAAELPQSHAVAATQAVVYDQQQHQQQQQSPSLPAVLQNHNLAAAPALLGTPEQQQAVQQATQLPQELQQLAQWDEPRLHWLQVVLGIGVVNILGLQAVLKLLQASSDSSTPVTVLVCRMGLRVDNSSNKLQERLHFLRGMMGVENAIFFTFEEAVQAICEPPRGCQLAYADLSATPLSSRQAGYDLFKQRAMAEQVRAQQEEGGRVLKGTKPEGPHHRNMLEKLLGAAETQDAEEAQACVLVTLVVLSKGTFNLPPQSLRSLAAFRDTMKSLCGHLKLGQLLAVELLMTPDSPQDFLSEAQLMSDYTFLTDLSSGLRVDHPDWSAAPSPLASGDDNDVNGGVNGQALARAAAAAAMADVAGAEGAASAAAAAAASDEKLA